MATPRHPLTVGGVERFLRRRGVVGHPFAKGDGQAFEFKFDGNLEIFWGPSFDRRRPWYVSEDQAAAARIIKGVLILEDQQGFKMAFKTWPGALPRGLGVVLNEEEVAEALGEIADAIQPQEDALNGAWSALLALSGLDGWKGLIEACAAANAAIEPYVERIARLTENSTSSLRSFSPAIRGGSLGGSGPEVAVWFNDRFPASFLRNVARYRSFDEGYWPKRGWRGYEPQASRMAEAA